MIPLVPAKAPTIVAAGSPLFVCPTFLSISVRFSVASSMFPTASTLAKWAPRMETDLLVAFSSFMMTVVKRLNLRLSAVLTMYPSRIRIVVTRTFGLATIMRMT